MAMDSRPHAHAQSVEPGPEPRPQSPSVRPIIIASVLVLATLWFLGSVVSAGDVVHAIGHLLPGGVEGCGGG
jgi:hypothetical protein